MAVYSTQNIAAVILAGGNSRRMNGRAKGLVELCGKPMLQHVLDATAPQVEQCVLSVNLDPSLFSGFGLECIADRNNTAVGPLGGIFSAMNYLKEHSMNTEWMLSVPTDCPFVPQNLSESLWRKAKHDGAPAVFASNRAGDHYLCALWSTSLADALEYQLNQDDLSARHFLRACNASRCEFTEGAFDPFFNVNNEEDLRAAEKILDTISHPLAHTSSNPNP